MDVLLNNKDKFTVGFCYGRNLLKQKKPRVIKLLVFLYLIKLLIILLLQK